jgi:hypothetical protein
MNPHALPLGHSYYTTSANQAESVAAEHCTTVERYSLGMDFVFGHEVIDPVKGGFMLIDWNTGKRSYKDPASKHANGSQLDNKG